MGSKRRKRGDSKSEQVKQCMDLEHGMLYALAALGAHSPLTLTMDLQHCILYALAGCTWTPLTSTLTTLAALASVNSPVGLS
jgi:hypothetical protein